MNDRDDFGELVGSAKTILKTSALHFTGRIRYGTKGEKVEERLLCMDAIRIYISSIRIPVKIESQFNILSIKLIERISDSHVLIETDEKQIHSLYGLHEKSSLQPFLLVLIRNLYAVFPHRLQAIVEIRPENEYDKLLRLSNEAYHIRNEIRPCGGYSLRYECACDFYQVPFHRGVQILVDTVFAHRISREFTFREFESIIQKEWLPIIGALRYNDWFEKLTIENTKFTNENLDELCSVIRLCKTFKDLHLINCNLRHDFCTRFQHSLTVSYIENLDLSYNPIEDKGLTILSSACQQRKLPLSSLNFQSCGLTHKSLYVFNTSLITNNHLLKSLKIINLSGNRIKEENCVTILFNNPENIIEELHLSEIEFSLEAFFHSLSTISCKLRRLFVSSVKILSSSTNSNGVKSFFTINQTLEILQISNANLSNDFLRELCDGLHSNVYLTKLDLRLPGNLLESFIHEYAVRFATIPCLIALDLTGCDLDNEIPNLLNELKKNRKLKSLSLGKNFTNIRNKNMQRTINSMKEMILESNLEYFSIIDSKLRENLADFLLILTNNCSLKTLDIRGNLMGDSGSRIMNHILQINRNLHTIYLDRNLLSLNNFEEIINAMEENSTIKYFPIPILDVIQMKITEKDRLEKIQFLINKLDTICSRNQQQKDSFLSNDSLIVETTANLSREKTLLSDNQQQLIGDQASFEYVSSCSNRAHPTHDLTSIFNRSIQINKIAKDLFDSYIEEEERMKNQWKELCRVFQEKFMEMNERLAKTFYQLYKEQSIINYDDRFQEQIRSFFTTSTDQVDQYLTKDIPNRLMIYSRQCYTNVNTCLQKRAYDTTNDIIIDMHKQMESAIFHTRTPIQNSVTSEHQSSPTTLQRVTKLRQETSDDNHEMSIDRIYSNISTLSRTQPVDYSIDNEGDEIEHDLLNLVEEEQQKDIPPILPIKTRAIPIVSNVQQLDLNIEPTTKLVHLGKDRPRRSNIRKPEKKLVVNEILPENEPILEENKSNDNESSPQPTVSKLIKSTLKPSKDESPLVPTKPIVQRRPSSVYTMTRSMTIANPESSTNVNTEPSMTASLYSVLTPTNSNEQKEINHSNETIPPVVMRTKPTIGMKVLPMGESTGEVPPVKFRRFPLEKKPSVTGNSPSNEPPSTPANNEPTDSSSKTVESSEQYKPLSVKERARMLATSGTSTEKKPITPISSQTPPYTPRTYRRVIEQVNLFC